MSKTVKIVGMEKLQKKLKKNVNMESVKKRYVNMEDNYRRKPREMLRLIPESLKEV